MFLVALDARGEWYRYHHLFGELLQLELGRGRRGLRLRAAAWCRAHGLVEEAIEHAAAAGDPETVAELLVEHDREFAWGGRLTQFLGWVRMASLRAAADHPSLPAAGAVAAALLGRPEVEVQRLLAVAERARRERPELWSPYRRGDRGSHARELIERGDVGAAVEHARRAVAAARGSGARRPGSGRRRARDPRPRAVLRRRSRGDADVALAGRRTARCPGRPEGYVAGLGLLALSTPNKAERRTHEALAHEAISFAREQFQADSWRVSLAHLGLALAAPRPGARRRRARGVTRRAFATLAAAHRRPRSRPARARTRPRRAIAAPASRQRPRTAQRMIAEFPDPGRLPAIAATVEHDLAAARAAGQRPPRRGTQPGRVRRAAGLTSGPPDARSARSCTSR